MARTANRTSMGRANMNTTEIGGLEKELETYNQKLPELMAHEGKFVVIRDGEIAGLWETYEDALQAGYAKFGLATPFLIKRVECMEQVHFFTREI